MAAVTEARRREIVDALRRGTVPRRGIEHLATGLDRFVKAIDEELAAAAGGKGAFKAVRGEYGCGKTFFARWVAARALEKGFAVAEVQISETETPLHRLETVYRRAVEGLRTQEWEEGAFRALVERWFYDVEEEVLGQGKVQASDEAPVAKAVSDLLEARLARIAGMHPAFASVFRAVYQARLEGDAATAEGLLSWLMGEPTVAASVKKVAGVKGEVDTHAASGFLRGLLSLLRQTGRAGLLLVLDEVETIQRMRGDVREKSLNALRQLIDDVYADRYPGLYLVITGTTAFFEGTNGVRRLEPLAQRLHVDFGRDPAFDSSRAVQIRLPAFEEGRLLEVGRKVRDLYPSSHPDRIAGRVGDDFVTALARQVAGKLGGKVGVAPRLFLKKLVGDVLDRVDEHDAFDPGAHYKLDVSPAEMSVEERVASGVERSVDEIELDLSPGKSTE